MRLVVVELVDAYRREHRVEDRELARREAADHNVLSEFSSLQLGGLRS